jgi:hypothetical protein
MGPAIGDALPYAVGVALSPIPIVAVIMMLFSKRARTLGPSFVIGWIVGIGIVGGIVLLLAGTTDLSTDSGGPSDTSSIIKLVLGVLLLLVGARQWRGRAKEGEKAELPKWMQSIDDFTPVKALGIAILLAGINPKNLILTIGGVVAMTQYDLSTAEQIGALLIFVLIGSISVIVPVVWYLVAPDSAATTLARWRVWLEQNNATVMNVLILIFGFVLIGKGIAGLTA